MSIIGIAYRLVPYLTDRRLWGRRFAVAQGWIYTIGVLIFARGMISGGLEGMPRRTCMAQAPYTGEGWGLAGALTGIGGTLMTLSIMMFFVVLLMTVLFGKKGEGPADIPTAETLTGPADSGWELKLDRFWLWFGFAVLLVVVAYGPFLVTYLPPHLTSPGFMF